MRRNVSANSEIIMSQFFNNTFLIVHVMTTVSTLVRVIARFWTLQSTSAGVQKLSIVAKYCLRWNSTYLHLYARMSMYSRIIVDDYVTSNGLSDPQITLKITALKRHVVPTTLDCLLVAFKANARSQDVSFERYPWWSWRSFAVWPTASITIWSLTSHSSLAHSVAQLLIPN